VRNTTIQGKAELLISTATVVERSYKTLGVTFEKQNLAGANKSNRLFDLKLNDHRMIRQHQPDRSHFA